jgi:hypothetical protein
MPTVSELASQLNREAAEALVRTIQAMPADKVTWKPLDNGRSALDQLQECAGISYYAAQVLQTRELPPFDREAFDKMKEEHDTVEKAATLLQNGIEKLTAAIDAFPPEHLDDTLTLPFAGGITKSFAELMLMSYWNMSYHQGQVNFIQTLYGDRDMH